MFTLFSHVSDVFKILPPAHCKWLLVVTVSQYKHSCYNIASDNIAV